MSDEPENKSAQIPKWLWVGSAAWLIVVFAFAGIFFWPNVGQSGLKPNEFGDLLAGAFSPLAFGWFVYAVFMQRQELELQRTELSETRGVLEKQEKAQSDSAAESRKLASLTAEQLSVQRNNENIKLFESYVEILASVISKNKGIIGQQNMFRTYESNSIMTIKEFAEHLSQSIDYVSIVNQLQVDYGAAARELDILHEIADRIIRSGIEYPEINPIVEHMGVIKVVKYTDSLSTEIKRRRSL
ncbi:MAG: hypothetical protein INF13_08605 [Methylobacterium sp.]|nr:hypothetical protein [Methylobacterium sp.]